MQHPYCQRLTQIPYNNATYVQGRVVLDVNDIRKKVSEEFSEIYTHFREFQHNPEYSAYWNKCMESISDRDLLKSVSVSMNEHFMVKTASVYSGAKTLCDIEN